MNATIQAMYAALNGGPGMVMIGGTASYDNSKNRLTVQFKGSKAANVIVIEYQPQYDLFVMTFWKSRNRQAKLVSSYEGILVGQVAEIFQNVTGLYLAL